MNGPTGRATAEVVVLIVAVYLVQWAVLFAGIGTEMFALAAPLSQYPWTIVTAVYAHAGPGHLMANLAGLVVFGFIVERRTTRGRFHAFVLGTGAIAGIAEVLIASAMGPSPMVLGISGAVFALMGYSLASNPVSNAVFEWLEIDPRIQIGLFVILAGAITLATAGERVALVAHFTGLVLGLVAGRTHLLRVTPDPPARRRTSG